MPTYEYKCDACGHAFEKFQSITAEPIKVCPNCGKEQVRKLISAGAGMIFKGSGFYITDYRDAAYKDKAKADAPATSEASKPTDGAKTGDSNKAAAAGSESTSTPAPAAAAPAASSSTATPAAKPEASSTKSGD